MLRKVVHFLLYRSKVSPWLYNIVYYRWQKRYKKQEGFLSGEKLHAYLPKEKIFRYHDEEQVTFHRPRFADADKPLPKQIDFYVGKTFTVSAGEVYRFDDAYLIGENAVGVTNDGQIILDTVMDLPNVLPKCSPRLLMNYDKLKVDAEFDTVLSLVHIFCNGHYVNYFHWLTDSLLLLEGARAFEKRTGKQVKILINDKLTQFQKEFLNLLDIQSNQLIFWKDYRKATVRELMVVKSRRTGTNMDEIVSPQGVRWLRSEVLKNLPSIVKAFGPRIFLSRQGTNCRRILNYEELLPLLEKYQFRIVDADDLTVAEQVQLFNEAQVLFTVHGAGLTNMIFSEHLKILELIGNVDRPEDFQWYCAYYSMSQALGHQYSFMECETIPLLSPIRTKQIYDIKVDLEQIDRLLNKVVNE